MDVYSNASSCSFIESFFTGEETKDEGIEWLSKYVEECFSDTTSYTTTPLTSTTPETNIGSTNKSPLKPSFSKDTQAPTTKSRSKRRRLTPKKFSLDTQQESLSVFHITPEPLLHHQTCWLAESELLVPIKREEKVGSDGEECEGKERQMMRKCSHCLSHKTPQWRAGPLGPKTLCNACGVSYKKGRLLPEYRPAKSPTFVSYKHSNSYKKVMEMRMGVMAFGAK